MGYTSDKLAVYKLHVSETIKGTPKQGKSFRLPPPFTAQLEQDLEVALDNIFDACRSHEPEQVGKKIDTLIQDLHDLRLKVGKSDPQSLGTKVETRVCELGAKIDYISSGSLRDPERQILRRISLDIGCPSRA